MYYHRCYIICLKKLNQKLKFGKIKPKLLKMVRLGGLCTSSQNDDLNTELGGCGKTNIDQSSNLRNRLSIGKNTDKLTKYG